MMLRNVRKRTNGTTLSTHEPASSYNPYQNVKTGFGKRPRISRYAIKVAKTETHVSITRISHDEK